MKPNWMCEKEEKRILGEFVYKSLILFISTSSSDPVHRDHLL